jgi:hypothetical protein
MSGYLLEAERIVRPPTIRCRTGMAGSLALVENRSDAIGDGRTLAGTFSVFDTWQEIREAGARFLERVQRGACCSRR